MILSAFYQNGCNAFSRSHIAKGPYEIKIHRSEVHYLILLVLPAFWLFHLVDFEPL